MSAKNFRSGVTVLLAMPILLQAILMIPRLVDWRPVWATYPDPGYQYIFAGGSIVTGGTTDLIFHPGTSFQWLIGLSQLVTHSFVGRDSFMLDVASRPEFYAQSVGIVLTTLYLLTLSLAAWRLFRYLGVWPAMVFQLMLLWGLPLLSAGRFLLWPESLVLISALASIALIAPQLSGRNFTHPKLIAIALALVAAVGMTAKITYLPLVVLVVILLGWRLWAYFLLPLVSAVLLLMLPVYSRMDSMQNWFLNITTNPGRHGQSGYWNPMDNFFDSMMMLNSVVRWFIPICGIVLAAYLATRFYPKRVSAREWLPGIALLVACGMVLSAGFKSSESRDFILIIPLIAALASIVLTQILGVFNGPLRTGFIAGIILLSSFLAAHGIVQETYFYRSFDSKLQEIIQDAQAIDKLNEMGAWAASYNAWTPDSSRVFGLIWSAGSFNEQVREISPEALHFDLFSREILRVNDANSLEPLTCRQMRDEISERGLGIIVEARTQLVFASNDRIDLSNATVGFTDPYKVGRYFAYKLTDVECKA